MKIINMASSDNFEDILEAVKDSESAEVILVIPKSNRVFKNKNKVEKLKNHFEKLNKDVSIISSGEETFKKSHRKNTDIVSLYSEKPSKEKNIFKAPLIFPTILKQINGKDMKNFILIFLGASLLFFILIVLTSVSQARIRIFPHKNDFSINIPVTISDKITEIDEVYGIIPGESIQIEKIVSKTFVSNGEKDVFQKARGKIIIYNNFSTSSQVLIATTRFQTPEGLVFRITKATVVPEAIQEGEKLKPGQIEVEVVADRAGEEYNIEPTEFKIPGFLGTLKYQGFYAKSVEKFSGGFIGKASIVTKEDMEKAENQVKEEAVNEIRKELALLINFKILNETLDIELETADSNTAGDLGQEFRVGYRAKLKTIAFREDDVAKFISQYVENSQDLKVIQKGLRIDYGDIKFNKGANELSLKLASVGQTAESIDKGKIISEIVDRKSDEAKSYLGNLKEVESAQIFLSPFWVRSIPKNKDRVEIQVVIE
ncbi:MAG: hypothetical protein G01um10142_126 [Parcubacteria group bacterium Gr01-1014_2]|nr:MAG: hypothetical protein G01um10142_126 [Parcubacteria group bacterium Gr01-1014_2]